MEQQVKPFSAADVARIRADRPIQRTKITQELPPVGSVILYNVVDNYSPDINGHKSREERGVGYVSHYTEWLMFIIPLTRPDNKILRGFKISDIEVNILRYVTLSEPVYTGYLGQEGAYTYDELSIESPHPDLKTKIIKK